MDEFWNWMRGKGYTIRETICMGDKFIEIYKEYIYIQYLKEKIPKQVLIGYMIEYLTEMKYEYIRDLFDFDNISIDDIYNNLEKAINGLDR